MASKFQKGLLELPPDLFQEKLDPVFNSKCCKCLQVLYSLHAILGSLASGGVWLLNTIEIQIHCIWNTSTNVVQQCVY